MSVGGWSTAVPVAAVLAWVCLGCTPDSPAPPLHVDYAGCRGARPGPVCLRPDDARLTLWIDAPPSDLEVAVDGTPVSLDDAHSIDDGVRTTVDVPATAARLEVIQPSRGAGWSLTLADDPTPTWLHDAQTLIDDRALDQADAMLRQRVQDSTGPDRGLALALRGQIAMRQGAVDEGLALLGESLPLLRLGDDHQLVIDKTTVLAYTLIVREHDLSAARDLLDALPLDWQAPGESHYLAAFYRGLLAMSAGDARGALDHLEAAVTAARRTGSAWFRRAAQEMVALQLQRIGRYRESDAPLRALLDEARARDDACRSAGLLGNLGLNELLARADGAAVDPRPLLHEALALLEDACPGDPAERQNAWLNLALAEIEMDHPAAARAALDRAAAVDASPGVGLLIWWREIEGRLALTEGRPREAAAIYESLDRLATVALSPEAGWRARYGRARARRDLGDLDGALDAFRQAEERLDQELALVPLQGGREVLLDQRQQATADHLEVLLADGRIEDARDLARRARLRLLRRLDQTLRLRGLDATQRQRWEALVRAYRAERAMIDEVVSQDWQRAADELQALERSRAVRRSELARLVDAAMAVLGDEPGRPLPPLARRPGEVAVVVHPLSEGWALFATRDGRTDVVRATCPTTDRSAVAACLVSSLAEFLSDVDLVRILAPGNLADVDFHAAALGDGALIDRAAVVYDLDLAATAEDPRPSHPTSALVIADPGGDLPAARREASMVRDHLRPALAVETTAGREATSVAVQASLPHHDLLHYAGHAAFAGRRGWRTSLPLADGGRLSVEDVLVLPQVPRWVVLSGCETARTVDGASAASSIGLAQAFALAGSHEVLAAARPVDDALAAALIDRFYPAWLAGASPAEALRQAQIDLARQAPTSDWASFRLIGRSPP